MPISAKLFQINQYPNSFPVESSPYSGGPQTDVLLKTRVELVEQTGYFNYQKLNILHDQGQEYEGIGYSESAGRIDDLIYVASEKLFPAYVDEDREWLISAFSSKIIFNQAFKRLKRGVMDPQNGFIVKPVSVDLMSLKTYFETDHEGPLITGGWFNNITLSNVSVAYIGGDEVSDSDDWDRYEANGLISALKLDFPNPIIDNNENEIIKILLTKDASIISYKHFDEYCFLRLCIEIFDIVKHHTLNE